MNVRQVAISDLKPYPGNPRKEHDVSGIVDAINLAGGFRVPIVVWEGDGCILAGHGRLLAAKAMGLAKVPVHYIGAAEIDEARARAWRIADNRVGERSAWDDRQLLEELDMLDEARRREAGFDAADEAELRRRLEAINPEPPTDFQEFDENIEVDHVCPRCGYAFSGNTISIQRQKDAS